MNFNEHSPLLSTISQNYQENKQLNKGLSVIFAIICIVDVFGVFPIVALPKAVIQCGWYGIPLVLFVFSLQIYTAVMLGKCWTIAETIDKTIVAKNRYPYAAIAGLTYGKHLARFVTILLDVTVFSAGIPNILVAAQNLQIVGSKISNNSFEFSYCYWMLIIATVLCPFLWLGSPKDMKILCSFSVVIVLSVSAFIWICILLDDSSVIPIKTVIPEHSTWRNLISAYGIIAFQFDIHPVLLTIHVDMRNKLKIPWVIIGGFSVTACLFVVTTMIAALKYGMNTYSNILEGLPPSILLYITVLLVTLQLCLTSAISNSALYQNIEDYLSIPRDFNPKRCITRTSLTILAVFVAEAVPRFDVVMSLIGGTLTAPLVFILPPLFYLKMMHLKNIHLQNMSLQQANHYMYHTDMDTDIMLIDACRYNCIRYKSQIRLNKTDDVFMKDKRFISIIGYELILIVFVILFGIVSTVSTTYFNIIDTIQYASFSPPCFYNLTAASMIV